MSKRISVSNYNLWCRLQFTIPALVMYLLLPPSVMAGTQATFYVSPTGRDDNAGTESAPFKTISAARDKVRAINSSMSGDIYVILRGGRHEVASTITLTPLDGGKNGFRVYYKAYSGETPIVSGATKVTGWTLHSGNIYKASLNRTTKLRNLYVNDKRALMTKKTAEAKGGQGTYSVTAGQQDCDWAWVSGTKSDGVKYNTSDIPNIAANKDDLEIINGTTWNENIVCVKDVVTTSDNYRALLLQQPYGAIAQLPEWGAGFSTSGTHTIYNAFEFLSSPGQFYFNKTTKTLYYYIRPGENMATADVEAPVVERLIDIAGTSLTSRVKNITFQGITFANTDYKLVNVGGSYGKATCQGANAYIAFGDGNWHNTTYEIVDVLPAMISVNSSDSIDFIGNTIKHSGSDGISMINDVSNCNIIGNVITDITSSGITIGHPQHVYIGDGGAHAKYSADIEGVCKNNKITNNLLYEISMAPGFGGCSAITAFFVESLTITYNHIESTAFNGINMGWGWINFTNSTTCKNNTVSHNRIINSLRRLHDSGAIYTIGQDPGTFINQNYVRGIPPATGVYQPTYGLHNDEGSAYITENDNVLDIDPGVKYTINCEDYGGKHDLTILRTYATVNKMGANPPNSTIDPPIVVSDNVWPMEQYNTCLSSGIQDAYRNIIPASVMSTQDFVFPASCAATAGSILRIRRCMDTTSTVWFAPSGTSSFAVGASMTRATGNDTSIVVPARNGTYKLCVVNSQGTKVGESTALLRVTGSTSQVEAEKFSSQSGVLVETCSEGGQNIGSIENGDYAIYNNVDFGSNGATLVDFRVASNTTGGKIEIKLDDDNGTLLGTCQVEGTGGWQTWVTKTYEIFKVTGKKNVYLKFTGGDGFLFNLNWFEFSNGAAKIEQRAGVNILAGFKTLLRNGSIIVRPLGKQTKYGISVFMANGRLIKRDDNVIGSFTIPVRGHGVYILMINYEGQIRKNVISYNGK